MQVISVVLKKRDKKRKKKKMSDRQMRIVELLEEEEIEREKETDRGSLSDSQRDEATRCDREGGGGTN